MGKQLACIFLFLCGHYYALAYEEYKIVYENGKAGIKFTDNINRIDKWVLPAEYDSVVLALQYQPVTLLSMNLIERKGYFQMYKSGKIGLFAVGGIDYNKIILPCMYNKIDFNTTTGKVFLMANSKWGVYKINKELAQKNNDGDWLLPVEWDVFEPFSVNRLCIAGKNGKVGVFDIENRLWVLDVEFDKITYASKLEYDEILLPMRNGKTGALSIKYDYQPLSRWIIPLGEYNNISHTVPRSNFLIVDSAGKSGLWQFTETKRYVEPIQKAWPVAAAEYTKISYKGEIAYLEKEGFSGSISKGGWLSRSDKKELNTKLYSICNTTVTVSYVSDSGYQIACLAGSKSRSIMIKDTVRYDSIALKGNIFYGYKARKITAHLVHFSIDRRSDVMYLSKEFPADGLIPQRSQLLVSGAQQFFPYPKSEKEDDLVIDRAITYLKDGKWVWRRIAAMSKGTGVETYPFTAGDPVDKWDTVPTRFRTKDNMRFLLVSIGGKWGITETGSRGYLAIEHDTYKVLNEKLILFRHASSKKWRLFDVEYASSLDGYTHPPKGALRVFSHLGQPTVDFSSMRFEKGDALVSIDGKEYYLLSKYQEYSTLVYYTKEKKPKLNHKVVDTFNVFGDSYTIEKTSTGLGLYKGDLELIPPYLSGIYLKKNELILAEKGSKDDVKLSAFALNLHFDADNFITITDTMTCKLCDGAGGQMVQVTRIEAGSTSYSTKKTTDYKEGTKSVYDPIRRGYVDVKTSTPVTKYETTTTKSADKTITGKAFDMCNLCKGAGYFTDVKRTGKVTTTGLHLSDYDPNKKGTTTTVSYPAR